MNKRAVTRILSSILAIAMITSSIRLDVLAEVTTQTPQEGQVETVKEEQVVKKSTRFGEYLVKKGTDDNTQYLYLINFNNIQNETKSINGVPFYTRESVAYPAIGYNSVASIDIPSLEKKGYLFKGWSASPNGSIINLNGFSPNIGEGEIQTINLYACYEEIESLTKTYEIKYLYEDNTVAYPSTFVEVGQDETISVESPIISGSSLINSSEAILNVVGNLNSKETVLKVYYRKETKEVEYKIEIYKENPNATTETDRYVLEREVNGKSISGSKISVNDTITTPIEFAGYTNISGNVEGIATNDTVLKVYYNANSYHITFGTASSDIITTKTFKYGQTIVGMPIVAPTRDGYDFNGFTSSNAPSVGKDLNGFITEMPNHNVHYEAKWIGQKVSYSIAYWVEKPNIAPSRELTEKERNNVNNYSNVALDVVEKQNSKFTAGSIATITESDLDKDIMNKHLFFADYKWNDASNFKLENDGSTVINVYFTRDVYDIVFDLGSSLGRDNILTIGGKDYYGEYTLTAKFEQDILNEFPSRGIATMRKASGANLYIYGWKLPSNGTSVYASKRFTLTKDMIPKNKDSQTATFVQGGEKSTNLYYAFEPLPNQTGEEKIYNGKTYIIHPDYTQESNYVKDHYSAKEIGGMTNVGKSLTETNGTHEYFYYTRNRFDLVFDLQGGIDNGNSTIRQVGIMFEQSIEEFEPNSKELSKNGYTFKGWYYDSNFLMPVEWNNLTMPNINGTSMTLFAKWESPSIIFDANGGELVKKNSEGSIVETVLSTKQENSVANRVYELKGYIPYRNGHSFIGWFEDEACTTPYLFNEVNSTDVTIYAGWIANKSESVKIIHRFEDDKTTDINIVLNSQVAGDIITVFSMTSSELINKGWIAGYYTADVNSQQVTVSKGVVKEVVFTYKMAESENYVYTVSYVDTDGNPISGHSTEIKNTPNLFIIEYFKYINGYELISSSKVSQNLLKNTEIIFTYSKLEYTVDYSVNIYLDENTIPEFTLDAVANRWSLVNPYQIADIKDKMEIFLNGGYVIDDKKSSSSKILGVNKSIFNIYLTNMNNPNSEEFKIEDNIKTYNGKEHNVIVSGLGENDKVVYYVANEHGNKTDVLFNGRKDVGSTNVFVVIENDNYHSIDLGVAKITVNPKTVDYTLKDLETYYKEKTTNKEKRSLYSNKDLINAGILKQDIKSFEFKIEIDNEKQLVRRIKTHKDVIELVFVPNSNYKLTVENSNLIVKKKELEKFIVVDETDRSRTYNGEKLEVTEDMFTVKDGKKDLTSKAVFTYSVDKGKTFTSKLPSQTNVGQIVFDVKAVVKGYHPAIVEDVSLTVTPAIVEFIITNKEKTVDDKDPKFTATIFGMVNGEELIYELYRDSGEEIGNYDIMAKIKYNENYLIKITNGILTIKNKEGVIVPPIEEEEENGENENKEDKLTIDPSDPNAFTYVPNNATTTTAIKETVIPMENFSTEDKEEAIVKIKDKETPLSNMNVWSLINLLSTLLACILFLANLILKRKNKEEDENDKEISYKHRKKVFLLTLLVTIGSIALLVLTQDFSLPMGMIDKYTIIFLGLIIIQTLIVLVMGNKKEEMEKDE